MHEVVVIKQNMHGEEVWRYSGTVLCETAEEVTVEARFNREDVPFHGIVMRNQDRFVETYYTRYWYNIMEIHDRDTDSIKGWYCNVTRPALFSEGEIAYRDLALDLLVYPDGRQLVLDEDEFTELELDEETRQQARDGLAQLQVLFTRAGGSFVLPTAGC
ncbi:MAG: hypothetical protein CVU39_04440 [Chloroflexi bacterium HGW-Chloroflexi-10]|nr:MAG: hypothetical protein CVU39_04440 [Chloroflexi bacterium HGW-Chloroflexi-10]